MVSSNTLQVGKIRDDRDLLTGEGQVDEVDDIGIVIADSRTLELCQLLQKHRNVVMANKLRWKMTGYDRDNTNLNYEDIINLPHPVSKRHKPMPVEDRAAQFAPFAALTGHQAAIEEAARVTDIRMELDEEMKEQLNVKLQKIVSEPGQRIQIVYYVPDGRKSGGSYKTKIGIVKKIDEYQKILVLEDGCRIPLEDISEIE